MSSLVASCTSAALEHAPERPVPPLDNRMTITGSLCTEDPYAVEFPVKVLFVVDTSGSMAITDPPNPADGNYTDRARATIDVINALAGHPGAEIGILAFHSSVNDVTGGFQPTFTASDVTRLVQAAGTLDSSTAQTNYTGALDAAYELVLSDIRRSDELVRARSRYVVIFLSDGLPNPPVPDEDVVRAAKSLHDLEREQGLVELRVHTVYLSGQTPPRFQQEPSALLRGMSEAGGGVFTSVANGERIDFLDIGFTSFRRFFTLRSFLVMNVNARPKTDVHEALDSDADGLIDLEEERLGTDPALTDTDGDGFSDRLEHRLGGSGFDPLDPLDADCAVSEADDYNRTDDDGDGLLNCEERFLGTNPRLFDSDADGLPDRFELLAGLSPVDDDPLGDFDRDGASNGAEVRDRTDPRVDDRSNFRDLRYRYDLRETGIEDSRVCYDFAVENIQLVPSVTSTSGENTILVAFGQAPADSPHDFGQWRVACVRARYLIDSDEKLPPTGRVALSRDSFVPPSQVDVARNCHGP